MHTLGRNAYIWFLFLLNLRQMFPAFVCATDTWFFCISGRLQFLVTWFSYDSVVLRS